MHYKVHILYIYNIFVVPVIEIKCAVMDYASGSLTFHGLVTMLKHFLQLKPTVKITDEVEPQNKNKAFLYLSTRQVRTQNFSLGGGGGVDPDTIYNLCFSSKIVVKNIV
jgi:hypothetical protein